MHYRWQIPIYCLLWLWTLPIFALQLSDGENFIYEIMSDGAMQAGPLNAYQQMYRLRINNTNYVGEIEAFLNHGQEVRTSVFTEPKTAIQVMRRIYVPKRHNFVRYMEILTNLTNNEQTVTVEVFGNLGSDSHTKVEADQGHFLITDDVIEGKTGSIPALLHYHSQPTNSLKANYQINSNALSWQYENIKIPPKARIRLIYFIAQTKNVKTAHQLAGDILQNPTILYDGMSNSALQQVINFISSVVTSDLDFAQAPFLNTQELRFGDLSVDDALSHQRHQTPADGYAIQLAAGQQVSFQMAANFDSYLSLFEDAAGEIIVASNDDQTQITTNAALIFTAPKTQTYYLEATAHHADALGEYSLQTFETQQNLPPQVYPFKVMADQFNVPATLTFMDLSQDLDGSITDRCWEFNDGSPRTCQAEPSITHVFNQAGYYSVGLSVKDNRGAWANRSEKVTINVGSTGVVLPIDNEVSGELTPSDQYSQIRTNAFADRYVVQAVAPGKELLIEMTSDSFLSHLYLYNAFNQRIGQSTLSADGQRAIVRYMSVKMQNLLIEATSFEDNKRGKYTLNLNAVNEDTPIDLKIDIVVTQENPLQQFFIARLADSFKATSFIWNFGDGSRALTSNQSVVSHTLPYRSQFTINVQAFNANQATVTGQKTLDLVDSYDNSTPTAYFEVSPIVGESPLQVFFTNHSKIELVSDQLDYLWMFGDGQISTDVHPIHTFMQEGSYQVILQTTSQVTQHQSSYSLPITVINRQSQDIPVTGQTRIRPQVLMAGFDPILIDLLDTELKVFAIIRVGNAALKTVKVIQNEQPFTLVMQHAGTFANGDQRYETVLPFAQGSLPADRFADLFGDQPGQYRVQAIDQSGQFHAFPSLEIGENIALVQPPTVLRIPPLTKIGTRRYKPQVLAAGFNPMLINQTDTEFSVQAMVRTGMTPIKAVTLQQNDSEFSQSMRLVSSLPNGDNLYQTTYTYPAKQLSTGTLANIFGSQPGQFIVKAEDQQEYSHYYPALEVGNYPAQ